MLTVPDVDAAVHFYVDRLGFRLLNATDGWAVVARDTVEVMFAVPNAHVPFERPMLTGSLYFRTDTVEQFWQELKDKASVLYPIEDFPYGMREFAVLDCHGYILQFGQPIEESGQ